MRYLIHGKQITQPTFEPITLAEAKQYCRIDDEDTVQDAVVLRCIESAREYTERYTGRTFPSRNFEARFWGFPSEIMAIAGPPLVDVYEILYKNTSGGYTTLSGSPQQYRVDTFNEPGLLLPNYAESWPATLRDLDAVIIRYTAGYQQQAAIPQPVKLWMQRNISTVYEYREQILAGTIVAQLPHKFVDGILDGLVIGSRLF